MGFVPYRHNDKYLIRNKDLFLYLEEHVRKLAANKKVPDEVFTWKKEDVLQFLKDLTFSDGHVTDSNWGYTTISKTLRDQVQILALYAGIASDYVIHAEEGWQTIKGKRYYCQECYCVSLKQSKLNPQVNHGHTKTQKGQIEEMVPYEGKVFCCTVPNHVIMVRRNGKTIWCGNSGRHGNKGIITKIIPDAHAPQDKDGKPVEVMLNPHGVISRINIGQMYESAVGKVAEKTGKPYVVENFSGKNHLEEVKDHLKKNNVEDTEELFNPLNGKSIGKVHVGNPYLLKLSKVSDVNFSVRGEGGPVSKTTMQPIRGGEEGAKALDLLTMYSMLSHGAKANLREMSTYKSENNPEFWEAVKYGRHLPAPKAPFVFEKLIHMMKASGIDVRKDGTKMHLSPLTDAQVKKLSKMEITNPAFIRASGEKNIEEKGGFLDPVHLGGVDGDGWGHIAMKDKMPNPVFEEPIRLLTGMTEEHYRSVLHGEKDINVGGKELTGHKAIEALLNQVDVDKELTALEALLPKQKGTALNNTTKKFRFLDSLKKLDLHPSDAYLRKNIPVIPPKFRPVSSLAAAGSKDIAYDDSNMLYRNIALINQQMKLPVVDLLDTKDLTEISRELYTNIRALSGLESVKVAGRDKAGFIEKIKGPVPKEGFFQAKVLRKNQNLIGRGTIIPEPQLHMDDMGMPEEMAWKLFAPFTIKELTMSGLSAKDAQKAIQDRSVGARSALNKAMSKRPILLNRAPSLHKFSIMAFNPTIVDGKAIKIPPLVTTGFSADFDGDTMSLHVPITDQAVRESYAMMPSRNLYKPGTGSLMVGPSQEAQLGFYLLTKTVEGRKQLNAILPPGDAIKGATDKATSKDLFMKLSKDLPNAVFSKLIDRIKVMGEDAAFDQGFTLSLNDIKTIPNKDKLMAQIEDNATKLRKGTISMDQFVDRSLGKKGTLSLIEKEIHDTFKGTNNNLYEMVHSGARGNMSQLRQIMASPMLVNDPSGKVIPHTIKKSFAEGLDLSDYWMASYGARRGMMDRQLSTRDPGVFNKMLSAVTMDQVVSMEDCGTQDGIHMPITSPDVLGRFLQGNQGGFNDETIINQEVLSKLKKKNVSDLFVRSPLKCEALRGVCRHCHGIDENGKVVSIGDNIGIKASQTLAEPMSQGIMRTFHTGGVAGASKKSGTERINELVNMPKTIKVGKATLAQIDGTVEKVERSSLGGNEVTISGMKHLIAPGAELKVTKGQKVKKGEVLCDGSIQPQELLKLRGMSDVQTYLTNELKDAFGQDGNNIERKTFETIVRAITNRTHVINNVPHFDGLPGDSVPLTAATAYNKNRFQKVPLEAAEGLHLTKRTNTLDKGTVLTARELQLLKGWGIKEVDVELPELKHEPYLKGIKMLPNERQDWLAQMGSTHLKDAIIDGASQGWMTQLKDYHPIPAFAYGATFGEGSDGRY
jgi:DNA-directed RNA polymerase subunit beta'